MVLNSTNGDAKYEILLLGQQDPNSYGVIINQLMENISLFMKSKELGM